MLRDVAEGFTWLWRHAFLRTCALLFAASNFGWEALFLILVVAARGQVLEPREIGVLIAAIGGASLLGSLVAIGVLLRELSCERVESG